MKTEEAEKKAREIVEHSRDACEGIEGLITLALLDRDKEAVKEVCEVLKPFAEMAPLKCRGLQDDEIIFCIAGQHTIRVGDFRKTAALLNKLEGRG